MAKTLFEKIWEKHVVKQIEGGPSVLYIDKYFIHEVTSPQAFGGLEKRGLNVFRPKQVVATPDHNVPTIDQHLPIKEALSRLQVEKLKENCEKFGIELYGLGHPFQGIVHVIGPELGITQPGMTIVCGDSHTSTHGAFGCIAFGIGTSEVEHVLATQCLSQARPKTMEVRVDGTLPEGVTAKDIILSIIGRLGPAGGAGYVVEYTGEAIRALSMEGRMTVCNMSIEWGARAGMVAPDDKTFAYLEGRPHAPQGKDFERAVEHWRSLASDPGAKYDRVELFHADQLVPVVTWGTNPGQVAPVTGAVPDPRSFKDDADRRTAERALDYMGLKPGTPIEEIPIERVFLGSCTNARIEDLRAAAEIVRGKRVSPSVYAMVVPGSMQVKLQSEHEGLDKVFKDAGFDWREAGCSMCLGMNPDILKPGERCASTSNRNFEGRQGKGGRTHLVSPQMAAAVAVEGHFVDIRNWEN